VRVLVLTPDYPPARGGIQTLVHRLVQHADGLTVRVVTMRTPGSEAFDRSEGALVRRSRSMSRHRLSVARLNAAAVAEASRFRPDVVLSAHVGVSPAASVIGRVARCPVVQYVYALELGGRSRLASFAVRRATATIAISRYSRDLAIAVGADPGRIRLIPPGVDLPPVARTGPSADDPPRVITVSRLADRYKGHDVLVRALPLVRQRVPGAEWVVVGDGPLRGHLERLARANGATDGIRFVGSVSDAERDSWLLRSRVFAMPSRLPAAGLAGEGFGIVYLEAGWSGLPVVAGNVAGALDAVLDGVTGVLVDPTDHVAVAGALSSLLEDPEGARRLGDAGIEHARERSWPAMAQAVGTVLRDVTATSR
jgi:phosphatidylinositol alpha-1,6-mannosyltransferase